MHSMTGLLSAKAVSFLQVLSCTAGQHVCCQLKQSVFTKIYAQHDNVSAVNQSSRFSPRFIMHSRTTCLLSGKAVSFHQDLSCTAGQHVCCQLKKSVFTKIYHAFHQDLSCTAGQQVCCQLKQSVFTKIYHAQQDNVSAVS